MSVAERKPRASELADSIAGLEPLDSAAEPIAAKVRELLPGGPVKDALSGTWLGHALHPVLQLAPLGTWMSAYPGKQACLIVQDIEPYSLADRGPRSAFLGIALMD